MTDRDDVLQLLSRYLSAVDRRDGEEASSIFAKGTIVEFFVWAEPEPRKVVELMEHELVAYIVDKMLPIHSRGEFCRHLTSIRGDPSAPYYLSSYDIPDTARFAREAE